MMQTYKWSDMVERINMNISWGPEQNKQDHATDGQVNSHWAWWSWNAINFVPFNNISCILTSVCLIFNIKTELHWTLNKLIKY